MNQPIKPGDALVVEMYHSFGERPTYRIAEATRVTGKYVFWASPGYGGGRSEKHNAHRFPSFERAAAILEDIRLNQRTHQDQVNAMERQLSDAIASMIKANSE